MDISNEGLELIKKFEGCKLTAYQDIVGVWTIGYGNTLHTSGEQVKKGEKITQQQADELLKQTVRGYAIGITKSLKKALKQNQFDSLVSLAYNVGLNAVKRSNLLKMVNNNPEDKTIAEEWLKWNKAGGKVVEGLIKRRTDEAKNYFK